MYTPALLLAHTPRAGRKTTTRFALMQAYQHMARQRLQDRLAGRHQSATATAELMTRLNRHLKR